jgi:acetyl esterase/lipase
MSIQANIPAISVGSEYNDAKIRRKTVTIGIPAILACIILVTTLLTQEYQMGKPNSAWRFWMLPLLMAILVIGYFCIPFFLKKKGLATWSVYLQGLVIYIVALAECFYFVVAYSMGGLATPEFMFSHLFFLVPYLVIAIVYFARMYRPARNVPPQIQKKQFIALMILTFITQWIAIPQLLQPQIQVRFEDQLEAHFGRDYLDLIPDQHKAMFGDGQFHIPAFFSPVAFERDAIENILVYDYGDFELRMHWFMPQGLAPNETRPGILSIHGGGFISGHAEDLDQRSLCEWWVSRGYVAGTLEYRLSPQFRFPNAIEDIRRAMVYLKANAADLHLDINRTALFGRSAGATLVINSLSADPWLFNQTGQIDPATMVPIKAVIAMYPVVNFVQLMAEETGRFYNLVYRYGPYEQYFGYSYKERPDLYEAASPTNAIHANFPPMLLMGGGLDMLTPKNSHFDLLDEACSEMGLDYLPLQIPWANHAFDELLTSRSGVLCTYAWERFMGYQMFTTV